jgi:aminopeptidase
LKVLLKRRDIQSRNITPKGISSCRSLSSFSVTEMQTPEFLITELDDETLRRMSKAIVHCMNFRPGESTMISGGLHMWKLVEMVRIECAKKEVTSITDLTTDEFSRTYVAESPLEFLQKPPRDMMAVANTVNASININKAWDPDCMKGLPREKIVAQREAGREVQSIIIKRGVRRLSAGYPTTPMARSFNVSFDELKELIVGGMLYSQELLLEKCQALSKYLQDADRVHLKDADGTDLTVHIRGRRISMSDGLISEEDQKIGYNTANLPTGEVFIAAHEEIGDGKLFCPLTRDRLTNKIIRNATLVFAKGRLLPEKCTAEQGEEEFKSTLVSFLKSDERRYNPVRTLNIGELGLGLNEKIKKPIGYVLTDEKIGGSAHIAIGDNRAYGGTSDSSVHWDFVTGIQENVTVIYPDGSEKMIVEDGRIVVA